MLIRCPTCASGYELADDALSEGRILCCAYCRDAWVHAAAPPPPASDAATEAKAVAPPPEIVTETRFFRRPGPHAARRATPQRRTASRRQLPAWARTLASSTLLLCVIGGGMAAVAAKAVIVAAFPPSEAVFATLGLPVNLSGLRLGEIRSTIETSDSGATLTLEGNITNLRADTTPLPPIRIVVRDKSRRELYYWTTPAPKAQLAVGETVLFHSRLSAPPREGQDLAVSFVEPSASGRRGSEVLANR